LGSRTDVRCCSNGATASFAEVFQIREKLRKPAHRQGVARTTVAWLRGVWKGV
jgi:hypothetical protein